MTATPTATDTRPGPDPSGDAAPDLRRRRLAVGAGLTSLFLVLTVVMAFPEVHRWRTAVPGDYGDPFLIQWLLRWDVHALFSGSTSIFDPNIYWPTLDTLLYSDTELAAAIPAGLLARLTGWTVAFNLIYLSGWMLSLAATYVLARWLRLSRAGAVLAGIVFTFASVRLGHYGHFQLGFAYFVPLTLWLLLRFLDERRWWQALAIGAACGALFLNAVYIAVILVPTLLIVAGGWLVATRFRNARQYVPGALAAGAVALAVCGPVVLAYTDQSDYLRRTYTEENAITFKDLITPAEGSWLYEDIRLWTDSGFENRLFPGYAAIAVGFVGLGVLAAAYRRPDEPDDHSTAVRRRGFLLVFIAGALVLLLCFGKWEVIFGKAVPLPYRLLAGLPGFESIRALGRFTIVPLLALGLLVAAGYDWLVRNRSQVTRVAVAAVLGAFLLVEYKAKYVMSPSIDGNRAFNAVNKALDRLPDDGAVVELPMGNTRDGSWAYVEAPRMVLSSIDWKPRVNGYSGYSSPGYEQTVETFNTLDDGGPASPEVLDLIDRFGVRYLVIRTEPITLDAWPAGTEHVDPETADRIVAALPPERVEAVTEEGAARLVRLRPPSPPEGATP